MHYKINLERSTKNLRELYYTGFLSHVYRSFLFEFMNRAIISDSFDKRSNRNALFSPKYRGKVLGGKWLKRLRIREKGVL
jgi:hypothetical protein